MRNIVGVTAIVIAWMAGSAFAMEPPSSSDPQSSSGSQPAASAEQAKSPSTSTAASTSSSPQVSAVATVRGTDTQVKLVAGDDAAAAQMKRFKAAGYKSEVRKGEVVWCRKEQQIGSRFEVKNCATAQQLEDQMRQAQDATLKAQRTLSQGMPGK